MRINSKYQRTHLQSRTQHRNTKGFIHRRAKCIPQEFDPNDFSTFAKTLDNCKEDGRMQMQIYGNDHQSTKTFQEMSVILYSGLCCTVVLNRGSGGG